MYDDQMEMFQDGGLKDQGNTIDPVSGNDVPSGSLKEEVRDDIDAKLSPGEFVFPADVVRFVGLEKLMMMRDKAKKGLSRMEDMGQMGNSDEATIDDDVPFGMEDLIIVSGGPENEMSKGGVPSYGRGGMLLGFDSYVPPTTYYNPATGQEMMSTKIGGDFFPPLPDGFVEKPKRAETKPRDVKTETTKVKSELGSGEVDGGPDRGDISAGEMTMSEKTDMPDFSQTTKDIIGGAVGFGVGMLGMGTTQMAAKGVGMIEQTAANLAMAGVKADFAAIDKAKATMASMTVAQRTAQRDRDTQTAVDRAQQSYENSVGAPSGHTGKAGVGTIGGIPSMMAVDVHGTVTDLATGDTIAGKDAKDFKDRMDKKAGVGNELNAGVEKPDPTTAQTVDAQERGIAGTPDPAPDQRGGVSEPGVDQFGGPDGPGSDSSAGKGGAGSGPDTGGFGGGVEANKGGFIRKKKKQKKMKRGGLASRK
jgi:hypothetical protein